MKKVFLILSIFISVFVQAQTPQTSYQVASIATMKTYFGNANRIHVVATNEDYVSCPSCTADEITIFAGAGSRKWKKVSDDVKVATSRTISTTSPLSGGGDLSANRTLSIADAAADGSTKGAASFTASDFNATTGNISLDYVNGQAATGSVNGFLASGDWTTFNNKQAALVSGTNIKTINSSSLLGSGDLVVGGSSAWGGITGTLSSQTDLQTALNLKADLISPSFTTPILGVAAATSINKVALTAPATGSTLTIADGKTFTSSNTLTLAGTDGSTLNVGTGGTLGTNAYTSTSYLPLASSSSTLIGNLLFTDNTYDIGASGATRPRTGYFGTSLFSPAINGGSGANDDITIQGTTNATRTTSYVNLQPTAGFVGIGTATPLGIIHANSSTSSLDVYFRGGSSVAQGTLVRFIGDGNADMARITALSTSTSGGSNTGGSMAFGTNFASSGIITRMFIADNGNIAIGTQTPTALLHIKAGTSTASTAPYKETAGTLLTVIEPLTHESNASGGYSSTVALNRYAEGGYIKDFITTVDNGTTVETDLYTYTTKANTLAADGEKLMFDLAGTLNDLTATAQLQFYYATTNIGNTGALTVSATGGWAAKIIIIRTSSSTARAFVTVNTPGASTALYTTQTDLTGITFTNTQVIKCTGTAGGASGGSGDISAKMGMVAWYGASNN